MSMKKFFDAHEIVNTGTPVLSMINNDYYEVNIVFRPVILFVGRALRSSIARRMSFRV